MPRPIIGITMGDPAGIGPEIVLKALSHPRVRSFCRPLVFGTSAILAKAGAVTRRVPKSEIVHEPADASFRKGTICVVEVDASSRIRTGKKSAASGKAALAYLDRAVQSALRKEIDAVVTAPVSKAAVRMAGMVEFIGHTEYLAKVAGASSVTMMFWSRRLKVALATTHVSIKHVASAVTTGGVLNAICAASDVLKRTGLPSPLVGVAGLNPHAGEDGAFGDEDKRIIAPAVRLARRRGVNAQGPLPADTLFRAAYKGDYDLVVAMFHDQALAPFKMIAFDDGVNLTAGLPFVRTSVDHGTAFDIAGKGIASERSLVEAIRLAAKLAG